MKLSDYAKENNVSYMTAWRWWKKGYLKGKQLPSGTILIQNPDSESDVKTVVYCRVSSSQNKKNLVGQSERVVQFCNARGWAVDEVVKEIGSGVNDNRRKLNRLLKTKSPVRLVVEHKDRLTRFGFNYLKLLIEGKGGEIVVINPPNTDTEDIISDLLAIVYSFTAKLYSKRRAKNVRDIVKTEIGK